MTYLDLYKISGSLNIDDNLCFQDQTTYPKFQTDFIKFQNHLIELVNNQTPTTFYKFGDGDYHFLIKNPVGSACPGNRALSVSYDDLDHQLFTTNAQKCDYYTCEIYPENRNMFSKVINQNIDYPAEYSYGLIANKWLFHQFKGKIGLIGASEKLYLIQELLTYPEYQNYLGIDSFNDYIHFPQKFAADDPKLVENFVGEQLKNSTSDIFLLGIGHSKSAILCNFPKYKKAVYLDVGAGIDYIAGCVKNSRPYAGDWVNYRIPNYDYSNIDYMNYDYSNQKFL